METRQERIEEQIVTIENYGSEMRAIGDELRYCEPDTYSAQEASSFSYDGIDFKSTEAIERAISNITDIQRNLNDMKDEYESAAQIVEDGADNLEEILDALREIQEILEEEVDIEVGQTVAAHSGDRFTVLAVANGKNENFAWVRNENTDYGMPSSFRWSELTVVE